MSSTLLRDPDTLFFQRDGVRRRIIAAYWVVVVLSVPMWWYTTSIQRLSLPSSRIKSTPDTLQLPVSICIEGDTDRSLGPEFLRSTSTESSRWRGLTLQVTEDDVCEPVDGSYIITQRPGPISIDGRRIFVPKGPHVASAVLDLISPMPQRGSPTRVAQYAPRFRLAFSLLNEDGAAGSPVMGWDIARHVQSHLRPILNQLGSLHNFTIESQVQVQAPLAFSPHQIDGGYGIAPDDLTVFVNSEQWSLSSGSSNDPVLHFLVFVPSPTHSPLQILDHRGAPSATNTFLLPQWGGIVIHNNPTTPDLSKPELDNIFSSFSQLLLTLLGVPELPSGIDFTPTSRSPLSQWQVDALLRRRTLENTQSSRETLLSLIKLVDSIENMPVGEGVKQDVQGALDSLLEVALVSGQSLGEAFQSSARAMTLASKAFFNPNMLALLYFPAEHRYAVYTPLFASAMIPLLVAGLREFKRWRKEAKSKTD